MGISFSHLLQTGAKALERNRARQIEDEERASTQEMETLRRALLQAQIGKINAPPTREPYTLGPGDRRLSGDNKVIAQGGDRPAAPRNIDPLSPEGITARLQYDRMAPQKEPKAPSEGERRASALLQVAERANSLLATATVPSLADNAASRAPLGAGNYFLSPQRKNQINAGVQLVRAYMYVVSGATVQDSEAREQAMALLPQPGDTDEVLAQKSRDREVMLSAIRAVAGRAGPQSPQRPATAPAAPAPQAGPGRPFDDLLTP